MKRIIFLVLVAIQGIAIIGLTPGCSGGSVGVGQIGNSAGVGIVLTDALLNRPKISEAQEMAMARAMANKFEKENKMWDDLLLEAYLTRIVQRLAPHVKPRRFVYRIRVVRNSTLLIECVRGQLFSSSFSLATCGL